MKRCDYEMAQNRLLELVKVALAFREIDEMMEAMNRAEGLGPVLDPTLFRNAQENFEHLKQLASAVRAFRRECLRIWPQLVDSAISGAIAQVQRAARGKSDPPR